MAGGTAIPYGNVKNMFVLSGTPSGSFVSATSITIATGGALLTITVPGILPGDLILDVNRPSNTVNGNTAPAFNWVSPANAFVSSAGSLSLTLANSSTLAVSTPVEAYVIGIARPDTTNPPSTTPTGIYS
jgi:hypothetical protein